MKAAASHTRLIILAAGRGRRMGAATNLLPKALIPLLDPGPSGQETFLGRLLTQWDSFNTVMVVAGWRSRQVRDFLSTRHPGVLCTTNRAFASSGSLASLFRAVTAMPSLMDGLAHTIYCDADIILDDLLATRIRDYRGPSAIVAGRNDGFRDDEQVCVLGTLRRPRFFGKSLARTGTGRARWLGEAAGIVILAPSDQPAALASISRILKVSPAAEHEDLTRSLMEEGRLRCLLAAPSERFMECDTPDDLRMARAFLKAIRSKPAIPS